MSAQTDLRVVLTQDVTGQQVPLRDSHGRVRVYDTRTVQPGDPASRNVQFGWADLTVTFDSQPQP